MSASPLISIHRPRRAHASHPRPTSTGHSQRVSVGQCKQRLESLRRALGQQPKWPTLFTEGIPNTSLAEGHRGLCKAEAQTAVNNQMKVSGCTEGSSSETSWSTIQTTVVLGRDRPPGPDRQACASRGPNVAAPSGGVRAPRAAGVERRDPHVQLPPPAPPHPHLSRVCPQTHPFRGHGRAHVSGGLRPTCFLTLDRPLLFAAPAAVAITLWWVSWPSSSSDRQQSWNRPTTTVTRWTWCPVRTGL